MSYHPCTLERVQCGPNVFMSMFPGPPGATLKTYYEEIAYVLFLT
jgi:hypothetical protein